MSPLAERFPVSPPDTRKIPGRQFVDRVFVFEIRFLHGTPLRKLFELQHFAGKLVSNMAKTATMGTKAAARKKAKTKTKTAARKKAK